MGRVLEPTEFALFRSIMALFMFLAAPTGAMSMLIVRKVSLLRANESLNLVQSIFLRINKVLFIFGLLILFLSWISSDYLEQYLKVQNKTTILIFSLMFVFSIFYAACMAFLQGLQRLIFIGVFGLAGVIIKLLIGIGLIKVGFGVDGALLGVLFSMTLVFVFAIIVLFKSLPRQVACRNLQLNFSLIKRAIPVLVATTVFAAMTQLDMAIVNWYFSPEEAGLYAAASVLGKAVLYVPGGLILVMFPMVSEGHAKGESSFEIFRQSVFTTVLSCGGIAAIYWFFGGSIISILFGEDYRGAGEILQWYGLAILPLTVVVIAEQYLIARGQVIFSWLFLFLLPFEFLTIYIWHSEIWMILLAMGAFGSLLAIVGCGLMWRSARLNLV
jgi:O-antigen/teichoic acid export membrane protein